MHKCLGLFLFMVLLAGFAVGQEMSLGDTVKKYNADRLLLNARGLRILGAWGAGTIAGSATALALSKTPVETNFHTMNMAWGVANLGIALIGYRSVIKQSKERPNVQKSWQRYKSDLRTFEYASIFDVATIGVGTLLISSANKSTASVKDLHLGYGQSLLLQGAGLLIFDNVMRYLHHRNADKWDVLMDDIRVTGYGLVYTIRSHHKTEFTHFNP